MHQTLFLHKIARVKIKNQNKSFSLFSFGSDAMSNGCDIKDRHASFVNRYRHQGLINPSILLPPIAHLTLVANMLNLYSFHGLWILCIYFLFMCIFSL